jgi:hypothetical protein
MVPVEDTLKNGRETNLRTTGNGVRKLIDMAEPTVEIPGRIATTKEGKIDTGIGAGMTTVDGHVIVVAARDEDPAGIGNMNRRVLLGVVAQKEVEARAGREWMPKAN